MNVPATLVPPELAVAFNCVPLKAVPTETAAGVFHVIIGVALFTVVEPLPPPHPLNTRTAQINMIAEGRNNFMPKHS
jgi:hypothetical protein